MAEKKEYTEKELIERLAKLENLRRSARELADQQRPEPEINIKQALDITHEKLRTTFGGRLVAGAFQLLVGPGEAGKGMCSTDIIARLSTGEPFPGEGSAWRSPMSVMICVTEDSASRVKGRLMAANADLRKVYFVEGAPMMRGGLIVPAPIAMDDDAGALLKKAKSIDAGALFLETMLEHLGDREGRKQWSTNNEAEVRRALAPIVALCREGGLIGWGVMHPRKSSDGGISDSISGSAAFNNVGRTVLHVYRDPSENGTTKSPWRLLMTSKSNYLAVRPKTLRFRIEPWADNPDEGKVVWGIEGRTLEDSRSAEDIWRQIRDQTKVRKDYAVRDAEQFLLKFLASGQKSLKEIEDAAAEEGHTWRAVERAKTAIGAESVKAGFPGKVVGWRLPVKPPEDEEEV